VNYVIGGFGRLPSVDELVGLRDSLLAGQKDCEQAIELLRTVPVPDFVREPVRCAALVPDDAAFFFGRTVRLSDGATIPVEDYRKLTNERAVPYSHAKHSLHDGRSYMVGALARLTVNGERIGGRARDVWKTLGLSVPSANIVANNLAQVVELVYSIDHALELVNGFLDSGVEPEPPSPYRLRAGKGTAATEAPRGILFHQYEVDKNGLVVAADVITPTAQNFSNAEDQFRATVRDGIDASEDVLKQRLAIVARAYDPCVSCSVHVVRAG